MENILFSTSRHTSEIRFEISILERERICLFPVTLKLSQSGFSQTLKIGNIGIIANFVFPYICSFLPYLHHIILVNVKFYVSGYK